MEWKFHRSKLWMSYFDEGSSLPAPFNIIVTPKSVYYVFRTIGDLFGWFWGKRPWQNRAKRATIRVKQLLGVIFTYFIGFIF